MTFAGFLEMIFSGNNLALIGAALATLMAGIGSAKGVNLSQRHLRDCSPRIPPSLARPWLCRHFP